MTADGQVVTAADESKKNNNKAWNWIILDSSGEEVVVDVEKRAIMQRVQIHARDLRMLDPNLTSPSAILGRQRAIILNLEHIKAIITSEEVLVRDPTDDNVVPVVEELRRRLKNGRDREDDGDEEEDTFEFGALEVILEAICSYLSARALELSTAIYPALDMIMSKISGRNLDRIRKLKSRMTRLTSRVQKVRDELEKLLEDDDDMANLYLSRKLAVAMRSTAGDSKVSDTGRGDETGVEELEMILEAYFSEIDGTLNNLNTLRQYVDNTEDYIIIQLDSHRNQLIQLELCLTAGIVCLALYSLVATIFGMNIPYSWMDGHGYMFKWVVIFGGVLSAVLFIFIMCYARYKGLVN